MARRNRRVHPEKSIPQNNGIWLPGDYERGKKEGYAKGISDSHNLICTMLRYEAQEHPRMSRYIESLLTKFDEAFGEEQ